ncbi:MAG: aspartate-semialdehyde dehydrogenase [SAR86 cluster bacterium]|nr:aspartate-semialdehyde dehydrogenase [SAR86 cluster bacterium]
MKNLIFPNIAIIGATGMVGSTFLKLLEEEFFLDSKIHLVASKRSAGKRIKFRSSFQTVENLELFDFSKVDLAFFSAGAETARNFVPKAINLGCLVVDNSSEFRYQDEIPLIIPEVNANALESFHPPGVIANPNCSTIQMLVALKPIHDEYKIKRINVTTMQAVSGTGQEAIEELQSQQEAISNKSNLLVKTYPAQIANNVLPQCDNFQENRYTREEMKMVWETHKILSSQIEVSPTCVRVPVFNGHSESIHLETERTLKEKDVFDLLSVSPGLKVFFGKEKEDYPTPLTDGDGVNEVLVGRIRMDLTSDKRLNLWVVGDNLLKGAALNSLQIAKLFNN